MKIDNKKYKGSEYQNRFKLVNAKNKGCVENFSFQHTQSTNFGSIFQESDLGNSVSKSICSFQSRAQLTPTLLLIIQHKIYLLLSILLRHLNQTQMFQC